jgi:hypothetical protein
MSVSAYTKAPKKQTSLSKQPEESAYSQGLEQALLSLESTCMLILSSQYTHGREDENGLMWQRTFKNIVTPISLALGEYKGPRKFHFHYKHREDDESVLTPVMDDPLDQMARVCQTALNACHNELVGIEDDEITDNRDMLEQALKKFLTRYESYKK